jgi:hypothetical protein
MINAKNILMRSIPSQRAPNSHRFLNTLENRSSVSSNLLRLSAHNVRIKSNSGAPPTEVDGTSTSFDGRNPPKHIRLRSILS